MRKESAMLDTLTAAEIFTGTVTGLSALGLIMKKFGYLHIGKKEESCPEPGCKGQVQQNRDGIQEIKRKMEKMEADIFPKINRTAEDVQYIKGLLDGKGRG